MTKKGGTIQGKKRFHAFLRICLIMERVSRKMLEKDFWDVSSMKHENGCGLADLGLVSFFAKLSTGWRNSYGLIF